MRPTPPSGLTHQPGKTPADGDDDRLGSASCLCTDRAPHGTPRLYEDGITWARPDRCESFGKDVATGEPVGQAAYRKADPHGKAVLKAAAYTPPREDTSAEYPLQLNTGRTLYHFHTRTKTGRTPQLDAAAPDVWVELSAGEAARLALAEGDLVEVRTARGAVRGRLRVTAMRDRMVFLPFHYGYWDTPEGTGPPTGEPGSAANELTVTDWDPASKQPLYKTAAALVALVERSGGTPATAPTTTASAPAGPHRLPPTAGGRNAHAIEDTSPGT